MDKKWLHAVLLSRPLEDKDGGTRRKAQRNYVSRYVVNIPAMPKMWIICLNWDYTRVVLEVPQRENEQE